MLKHVLYTVKHLYNECLYNKITCITKVLIILPQFYCELCGALPLLQVTCITNDFGGSKHFVVKAFNCIASYEQHSKPASADGKSELYAYNASIAVS